MSHRAAQEHSSQGGNAGKHATATHIHTPTPIRLKRSNTSHTDLHPIHAHVGGILRATSALHSLSLSLELKAARPLPTLPPVPEARRVSCPPDGLMAASCSRDRDHPTTVTPRIYLPLDALHRLRCSFRILRLVFQIFRLKEFASNETRVAMPQGHNVTIDWFRIVQVN